MGYYNNLNTRLLLLNASILNLKKCEFKLNYYFDILNSLVSE